MKKTIKNIFIIAVVSLVGVACFSKIFFACVNNMIVNSSPNYQEFESSNSNYTVKLKEIYCDDIRFYKFYVIDINKAVVFTSNEVWRAYDFKDIVICENNDIIIVSGDTGESLYSFENNGQPCWKAEEEDSW